jgi:hypothetical protein
VAKPSPVVPSWATQLLVGLVVVLIGVAVFSALLGTAARGPSAFLDELGRTVSRAAPQPQAELRSDADVRRIIEAMPGGRLRVASIVAEQDRVVFTIAADRSAVHAAVAPGDELRISRAGEIEIAPTGVPGVLDDLQRAVEDLRQRLFGR